MQNNLQMEINKISFIFEKCFINNNNELILEPKNNIYFRLEDVNTVLEIKCKMIAWLSRHCYKGLSNHWQKYIRERFNRYFNTKFEGNDFEAIYGYLGADCNRNLTIKFIESNYNLEILTEFWEERKK